MYMSVTDAQKRATAKFEQKKYDKILLRLEKGEKDKIKSFAATNGESVNGFIRRAIEDAMKSN